MTELFKDRINMNLVMATLFCIGAIASIYAIYSLPHNLMLNDGYQPVFADVYVIVGLTFLIGGLTIWYSVRHKNEVIVYKEKQDETNSAESTSIDNSQTTISLETVKSSLKQAKNEKEVLQSGLNTICKQLDAGQGAVYATITDGSIRKVELRAGYALSIGESAVITFEFGEGLVGQAAAGGRSIYVDEVPEGYIKIISGLGSASPRYLLIVPIKTNDQVIGVMEIASFTAISDDQRKFVEESAQLMAGSLAGN